MDIPFALLQSYAVALPRLRAGASLRHVAEVGIGTGSMEAETSRELLREWEDATESGSRVEKLAEDEKTEVLRGIGIQVG